MGIILGFTGAIESITPNMAAAAELAWAEINEAGTWLGGQTIVPVRGNSGCTDTPLATATAERLVSSEGIVALMGPDCSGVTIAVLQNVAMPNGLPMISPAATSPALTTIEDDGLFFRTAPSDARQGQLIAEILLERGITDVAVTYTNNDYGLGLSNAFSGAFTSGGGTITATVAHEDGRGDYSAEVGTLASAGGQALAVFGYADLGGVGMIQASVETGAFETFILADGMFAQSLIDTIGPDLDGSFGVVPWTEGEGTETFAEVARAAGIDPDTAYTRESYDAAALLALAAVAGGEASSEAIAANILRVANAPGEPILPGELARAIEILADGGEIDYVGASNVELIGPGEAAGSYREYNIESGSFVTVSFR